MQNPTLLGFCKDFQPSPVRAGYTMSPLNKNFTSSFCIQVGPLKILGTLRGGSYQCTFKWLDQDCNKDFIRMSSALLMVLVILLSLINWFNKGDSGWV